MISVTYFVYNEMKLLEEPYRFLITVIELTVELWMLFVLTGSAFSFVPFVIYYLFFICLDGQDLRL